VGCFIPPPPPLISSARIDAPQSPSELLSLDWLFDISFSAPYCIPVGAPHLEWVLVNLDQERLYFIPDTLPPSLTVMLIIDGLLRWIGAPWPGFAPPSSITHTSITIITPLAHPALHIRHSSFPGGEPLFPTNSSYCLSNSILIHCELISRFQPFRYYKSSQPTFAFHFAHLADPNYSEIQHAPPGSLRHWWIVCSRIHQPQQFWRFSEWHWDYVRLLSFDHLAWLLFLVYLLSFLNHSSFSLVLLNVAMQQ